MGDAYTPGLTVTGNTTIRKTRRLPLPGTVLVKVGDRVQAMDVVARTDLPGRVHLINIANRLGVLPDELAGKMLVEAGAKIAKGQRLAESKSFFGVFTNRVESPIEGTLESVSSITGQAILREPPSPVEVKAYIDGTVVEEIATEGVVIETEAALIQGIFGLAGETRAELVLAAGDDEGVLDAEHFTAEHTGKVVVGRHHVTLAGMRRAIELKLAALVVGGFAYHDIKELLGYDIGVAVTGTEDLGTTLMVTEGFGEIAMARATYELLTKFVGQEVSVTGATQIRAGVIRPEVVRSYLEGEQPPVLSEQKILGLSVGAPVRCIRAPYFGRIGTVKDLPVELQKMDSETMVRVLTVQFDDGDDSASIPRANVEVIER
jgi:hypothetical protein